MLENILLKNVFDFTQTCIQDQFFKTFYRSDFFPLSQTKTNQVTEENICGS